MSHDLTRTGSEPIGRERELAVLETWLQRPTAAHVIFNYGENGIGKTRRWGRGIELARARGCRILSTRSAQAEAGMGFAALGNFLQGVPGEAALNLAVVGYIRSRASLRARAHRRQPWWLEQARWSAREGLEAARRCRGGGSGAGAFPPYRARRRLPA